MHQSTRKKNDRTVNERYTNTRAHFVFFLVIIILFLFLFEVSSSNKNQLRLKRNRNVVFLHASFVSLFSKFLFKEKTLRTDRKTRTQRWMIDHRGKKHERIGSIFIQSMNISSRDIFEKIDCFFVLPFACVLSFFDVCSLGKRSTINYMYIVHERSLTVIDLSLLDESRKKSIETCSQFKCLFRMKTNATTKRREIFMHRRCARARRKLYVC